MVIEKINEKVYKVSLTDDDLSKYDISFDNLDYKETSTLVFLTSLIEKIKIEINIDICIKNLYIESFPSNDGGCILYLNIFNKIKDVKLDKKTNINNTISYYCFYFSNLDNLILGCNILSKQINTKKIINEVYSNKLSYYLIIGCNLSLSNKIKCILLEYGELLKCDKFYHLHIKSQYNAICEKNAIDTLKMLI